VTVRRYSRKIETRVLFLDDSGKPDSGHPSKAVVLAGLSIDASEITNLNRKVSGAKGLYYGSRGKPNDWEIKSAKLINPNPWNRSKNREFARELVRILHTCDATTYSTAIIKKNMKHQMNLTASMPLQLQSLVEHFDAECRSLNRLGLVVSDWSSYQLDYHASRCVGSFVVTKNLSIVPSVFYGSSMSNQAIQLADFVAAVRRRTIEGDGNLDSLQSSIRSIISKSPVSDTFAGRIFNNCITLF